jgi:hypothetical protein
MALACALAESWSGGAPWGHTRAERNALSSASRVRPLAPGTRWPYRSTVVSIGTRSSLTFTNRGNRLFRASLAVIAQFPTC